MASGARAKLYGFNAVGLKRRGFADETGEVLKKGLQDTLSRKEDIGGTP